jgi:hypothetical protein
MTKQKSALGRSSIARLQETEVETPAHWVKGVLSSGDDYWWRFDPESGVDEEDAEIALEQPPDAWRMGELPDGRPYIWRDGEDEDDPEIMIWSERELSSGAPFWYAEDGTVSLTDPFDLTVVQRWTLPDEDEAEEDE